MELKGLELTLSFSNSVSENLKTTSKDDKHLHRFSDD